MTDSYRNKIDEAAYRYWKLCQQPGAWVTFIAGAQFVLDNPPEEWAKIKEICIYTSATDRRSMGDILVENKRLRAAIEALIQADEALGESLNKVKEALAPFRKDEP